MEIFHHYKSAWPYQFKPSSLNKKKCLIVYFKMDLKKQQPSFKGCYVTNDIRLGHYLLLKKHGKRYDGEERRKPNKENKKDGDNFSILFRELLFANRSMSKAA
jgi:hypothetical protein